VTLPWTHGSDVRAGIRPVLADLGHTAQFLANRRIALTLREIAEALKRVAWQRHGEGVVVRYDSKQRVGASVTNALTLRITQAWLIFSLP
jgi:hypothetical protein